MEEKNKNTIGDGENKMERQHEEDESWISGEELYTEESTEEDEGKLSDNALQERKKKRENRRTKAKRQIHRQGRKDTSSGINSGNNVDFLTEEDTLRNLTNSNVECVDVPSRVDSLVDNIYEKMVQDTKPFDEENDTHLLKAIKMPKDAAQLGGIYEELSTRDPSLNEALLKMYQLDKILEKKEEKLKEICQKRQSCCSEDRSETLDGSSCMLGSANNAPLSDECENKSVDQDDSGISTATSEFDESIRNLVKAKDVFILEWDEDERQLTDDDKKRLEEILGECETSQPDAGDSATTQTHPLQAFQLIDEETEKKLLTIERQLLQLNVTSFIKPVRLPEPSARDLNLIEIETLDCPHGDDRYHFMSDESEKLLEELDTKLKSLQEENAAIDSHFHEVFATIHRTLTTLPNITEVEENTTEEDLQNPLLHDKRDLNSEMAEIITNDSSNFLDWDLGGELVETTVVNEAEEATDKSP